MIIEGETYNEEMFIQDYNNGLSRQELMDKYQLGAWRYSHIIKELINDGQIKGGIKYYYKINGKYRVYKAVNGERVYFGQYPREEDAQRIVEELIKVNWDKNKLEMIKERVL